MNTLALMQNQQNGPLTLLRDSFRANVAHELLSACCSTPENSQSA